MKENDQIIKDKVLAILLKAYVTQSKNYNFEILKDPDFNSFLDNEMMILSNTFNLTLENRIITYTDKENNKEYIIEI